MQLSVNNYTAEQYQGVVERVMISTLSTVSSCVFLYINGTLLFILRSKPVFRETSCYILLYNLLFADTVHLVESQILYLLAVSRTQLTYPVCGVLIMFAILTNDISPLTLLVMSLERYVAVCHPLRHAAIITIRNTWVAMIVVWVSSSVNVLTRILFMLNFPFENLQGLLMKDVCSDIAMLLGPLSSQYNKAYTCFLFVSATVVIISSYVAVMVAARSASTNKASAQKARNTLLLHAVQLGLSFPATIYNPILTALSTVVTRITFARINTFFYVCIVILPRCLSCLIFGLRDQAIRSLLTDYLCCRLKLSVVPAMAEKRSSVRFSWRSS